MDFYVFLTGFHNLLRWLVVIGGVLAFAVMLTGLLGGRRFGPGDRRAGLIYTAVIDLQLLVGLLLFFVSPLTSGAMQNMGVAMGDSVLRFFLVEHTLMMVLAVVAAHIGYSLSKKETVADRGRFMRGAIFYGLSLVLIALAIPWDRSLLPWG